MTERRILFLALSGVRVHEAELRHLGMTLPGFIERGNTIARLPSLGLLTLAGLTPENWHMEYRDVDGWDSATIEDILAREYHIVAISALTARIMDAYAIADQLRDTGLTVILGGLHVSAMPMEASQHADAVIVGEGESVWQQVLADYLENSLRPVYKAEKSFSFRQAPVPRYDLLDPAAYNRITLQTTRGCPLDCQFCGASRLISPFKQKPLELVQRNIEAILQIWQKPFLELADDNTFVDKVWARELIRLLSLYDLRWFTETDISIADDPELLELLGQSGCVQVLIGLESVSAESLDESDTRSWKKRRRDNYLEAIARIQSYGISVNGCFAVGFDDDAVGIFESTRDFVRESQLSEVQITVVTPFPGTRLYSRLEQDGRLLPDRSWHHATLFDVMFQPARMSVRELEQGVAWLMKELYNESETGKRREIFRKTIRHRKSVQ